MRKKQPTGGGIAIEAANPTDRSKGIGSLSILTPRRTPYRLG
ncbi:MAG: hypothetical protein WBB29_16260 [Geitlerinemataceae cyanobacterium]